MFEKVQDVIADTFNYPKDQIMRDTVAEDVNGWDSLSHTILMIRLQKALGLQIPEQIAAEAATVGELADQLAELARAS
jgi:acyl carrier protein